ncbi:hypothetical protein ACWF9G_04675, partial [Nocardia sp. NPDC055029]
VQQATAEQREAALDSITEAVQIRRSLAQTNPAAFLPALAGSLNNLAIQQATAEQREAALDSITEAVQIRRSLAQTNPAAFLPALAMSLNNLAIQQAKVGQHAAATLLWQQVADSLDDGPAAEIIAARVPFQIATDLAAANADIADAARRALAATEPGSAGRARRAVRSMLHSHNVSAPDDETMTGWLTRDLPEHVLTVLKEWADCGTWSEREALLAAHLDLLQSERGTLAAVQVLWPEVPELGELDDLLADIQHRGAETVLAEYRDMQGHIAAVHVWIDTATWAESREYLEQHRELIVDTRTLQLLARLAENGSRTATQHFGIIALAQTLPLFDVYDIVTDGVAARDAALRAVAEGDLARTTAVLTAVPRLLEWPFYGRLLTGMAKLLAGDAAAARRLLAEASNENPSEERDSTHLRIAQAKLRQLALARTDLAKEISELVALLDARPPAASAIPSVEANTSDAERA